MADEFGYGFNCFVLFVEVKMTPMDAIWLFALLKWPLPTTLWLPAHPSLSHPYRNANGIGYASKNYQKWQAIQPAIHLIVGE